MTARWYRFLPERMDGVTSRRPRCRPTSDLPAVRLTGAAVAGVSGQRRQRLTSQETPQTPPLTSPNASIRRRDQWFDLLRSGGPEAGPDRPYRRPARATALERSRPRSLGLLTAVVPRRGPEVPSTHARRLNHVVRVRDRGQYLAGRRHFLGIDRRRDARLRPISAGASTASYRESVVARRPSAWSLARW
jgi:hypothetical protein